MAANSVIDRILSTLTRIWVDVRQRYTEYYDIDDFDDDDLINKRAAQSIANGAGSTSQTPSDQGFQI